MKMILAVVTAAVLLGGCGSRPQSPEFPQTVQNEPYEVVDLGSPRSSGAASSPHLSEGGKSARSAGVDGARIPTESAFSRHVASRALRRQ